MDWRFIIAIFAVSVELVVDWRETGIVGEQVSLLDYFRCKSSVGLLIQILPKDDNKCFRNTCYGKNNPE
jgi:hypothetical protein